MCRGRRARILLHLHIQREKIVLRGTRSGRRFGCRNHPSCVYVLGRRTSSSSSDKYVRFYVQAKTADSQSPPLPPPQIKHPDST
jgi:hypothetical protein